jgi:ferredoxin
MRIHPLNVKGKYYVDYDVCTCSAACEYSAANNIKIDTENYSAYFAKQPETQEEEEGCKEAMLVCPVEAILDDGEIKNQ